MPANTTMGHDAMLFSYVIASADMRHIERSERVIHLRHEEVGPVVRGEMPECGPSCYADLGQVLLEYVMSCESCKDEVIEADMARGFGERLGKVLVKKMDIGAAETDEIGRVAEVLECVLNSVDVPFELELTADKLRYDLKYGPIEEAAEIAGIRRGQPMARRALIALCDTLVETLAPGWQLETAAAGFDHPLNAITVVKVD